ncbi:MAG TPA: hypothetical protein VL688_03320 [Verrucomicrobiae bacterium]|jgi:hypothetical protein|nr:hypothetical protein [Verrucomicrobiae bacterium]
MKRLVLPISLLICAQAALFFAAPAAHAFDPGLPPIEQSKAYGQFQQRPFSDLSVLIYLIDRFKEAELDIVYDGHYFPAPMAARLAKWFLGVQYRKERPVEWIMKWCNVTVPNGVLIWVKDGKNKYRLSREILLDELKELEKACMEDPAFQQKAGGAVSCKVL